MTENIRPSSILFGESQSRIIISINKSKIDSVLQQLKKFQVPYKVLGSVGGDSLNIAGSGWKVNVDVAEMEEKYRGGNSMLNEGIEHGLTEADNLWQKDKMEEACGVFGIYAPGKDVARLTYYALYALQHRGQESAGIGVTEGNGIKIHKAMGLVSEVFTEQIISGLKGDIGIGHVRYSTMGSNLAVNSGATGLSLFKR